jgi:two-component system NtrC family response regulator
MSKPKLLVVDDEEDLRTQMKWALAQDYEVLLAQDRPGAVALAQEHRPSVVTLDLGLPPRPQSVEEGFATLGEILRLEPGCKVIVITGREEREHARNAVGQGAYDFFSKPIEIDELKVVLRRAFHVHRLEREHQELQNRVGAGAFEGMIGESPAVRDVFAAIRKVGPSDVPVLILGESGVGKELVAQAIHRQSPRANGPFVAINCGAIPENLLESELFGYEKGAFTGAHQQRRGRIELSHGGTLFLDEIGELPTALQVKLLRFLQERRIERIGGRQTITVDARFLAATNVDLQQAMNEGKFREDLFYRLSVVSIPIPPLRDRAGDIELLAQAMLQKYAGEAKKKVTGFARDAVVALNAYHWPGNVRELENRIRRAVVMGGGASVTAQDLELTDLGPSDGRGLREARQTLERETIQKALQRNTWNISRTAAELGVSRPTLYGLMEKLGINRPGA